MKTYLGLLAPLLCVTGWSANAQDLIRKIPADAQVVVAVDGKKILSLIDVKQVDSFFMKMNFWNKAMPAARSIQQSGIDFNNKGYIYTRTTDSVIYVGGLFPLQDAAKFNEFIGAKKKVQQQQGYNVIVSTDKLQQFVWDDKTVYYLVGTPRSTYFNDPLIAARYGIDTRTYSDFYPAEEALEDQATLDWNAYDFDAIDTIAVPALPDTTVVAEAWDMPLDEQEEALADTAAAWDYYGDYSDDYYAEYTAMQAKNDSIQNQATAQWLQQEIFQLIQHQNRPAFDSKAYNQSIDKNAIAHLWVKNIDGLYEDLLPSYFLDVAGVKPGDFRYGLEQASFNLIVDGNRLKVKGDIDFSKEVAPYFQAIYNRKLNPKFLKYIDKSALGFMSYNINTEAYINAFPKLIDYYGNMLLPNKKEEASLVATLFDVLLDQKAIDKVWKGDNLIVLNGVQQQQVKYVDYEYDENYDYTEVEKTKMESIPTFLGMFSSEDTRVFQTLIALAIREEKATEQDGIYHLNLSARDPFPFYVLFQEGIVFAGNDLTEITDIKHKRSKKSIDPLHKKILQQNNFSFLLNTKRIPDLLNDLAIPVDAQYKASLEDLKDYGNFYFTSGGMKGNRVSTEGVLEFPSKNKNALDYIYNLLGYFLGIN